MQFLCSGISDVLSGVQSGIILPESIHRTSSQAAFKRQLKTFLFCDAFNIAVWTSMNIRLSQLNFIPTNYVMT